MAANTPARGKDADVRRKMRIAVAVYFLTVFSCAAVFVVVLVVFDSLPKAGFAFLLFVIFLGILALLIAGISAAVGIRRERTNKRRAPSKGNGNS